MEADKEVSAAVFPIRTELIDVVSLRQAEEPDELIKSLKIISPSVIRSVELHAHLVLCCFKNVVVAQGAPFPVSVSFVVAAFATISVCKPDLSWPVLFLFVTVRLLEARRWRG